LLEARRTMSFDALLAAADGWAVTHMGARVAAKAALVRKAQAQVARRLARMAPSPETVQALGAWVVWAERYGD
jgi:hypothetical protein